MDKKRYNERATKKRRVILGLLGTTLDVGRGPQRWERWRPTVSLFQQEDFVADRLELLHPRQGINLAKQIAEDVRQVSPGTEVRLSLLDPKDPWDFEEVYTTLHDFARGYSFDTDREDYYVHITTGTHVAQICLFLLAETRVFPAKLVQSSPRFRTGDPAGELRVIDLDLSKYDAIAARFKAQYSSNIEGLKSGIATQNTRFNRLIEEIEQVAANSTDPILLTGPTGAGKSHLAKQIYDLKRRLRQVEGPFVEVNCATLRGDGAMSTLFGHRKGAFTGAVADRPGLLLAADGGVLFLDEIGELGLDEQAMLLRAIEEKRFLPLGADQEQKSNFILLTGTNRDLAAGVRDGSFREDLLARVNLWTFRLPALRDRLEDIEPNLDFELERVAARTGRAVRLSAEARAAFVEFATSRDAAWSGNFRDLGASVTRMSTLCPAGRITPEVVAAEIVRLRHAWSAGKPPESDVLQGGAEAVIGPDRLAALDRFDRVQLCDVVAACLAAKSLSDAGRVLFARSRELRSSVNDADRLRKYLARFGLTWQQIEAFKPSGS
jgi:transcriptional regulatory protein RtcR